MPGAPPQKLLGSGTEQALLPRAVLGVAADNAITRRGGARGAGGRGPAPRRVVVDVREFMSHLPAVLHQQGLELVPVTLEVPPPPLPLRIQQIRVLDTAARPGQPVHWRAPAGPKTHMHAHAPRLSLKFSVAKLQGELMEAR